MKNNIQFFRSLLLNEMEDSKMCKECGAPMEEGMCTECGYMEEMNYDDSGLAHPEKADLDKNKDISSYEKKRGTAIEKNVSEDKYSDAIDRSELQMLKNIYSKTPTEKIKAMIDALEAKLKKEEGYMGTQYDSSEDMAVDMIKKGIHEEDHEVSMANNSLKSIISSASELLNKIGHDEKDIPAWIQDHITNAENYINQASKNYHEYESEEELEDPYGAEEMYEDEDDEPSMSAIKSAGGSIAKKRNELAKITALMKQLAAKYKAGDTSVIDQLKKLTADKKRIEAELVSTDSDDDMSLMSLMEGKKKKPSAGLTKKQKSAVAKKAKAGKDIGKKGKGFAAVEKKAKESGADNPKAVAAAAMWKGVKARAHKK